MDNQRFFHTGIEAQDRKVWLRAMTLLPGKGKGNVKQLQIKMTMPLTNEPMRAMPDFLEQAYEFVTRVGDPVSPDTVLRGCDVEFASDMLFGKKSVAAPRATLKNFSVEARRLPGAKEEDGKIVVALFTLQAAFSDALCRWAGQMLGTEVYARFSQALVPVEAPPPPMAAAASVH